MSTASYTTSFVVEHTRLRFTHDGLVPEFECFTDCSNGWGSCVKGSLRTRITTGAGHRP